MYSHYELEKIWTDRSSELREASTRERQLKELRRERQAAAGSTEAKGRTHVLHFGPVLVMW